MGERQGGPLGLHRQLDTGLLRSFREMGTTQRLVVPNHLGSPAWSRGVEAGLSLMAGGGVHRPSYSRPKVTARRDVKRLPSFTPEEEGLIQRLYEWQVDARGGPSKAIAGLPESEQVQIELSVGEDTKGFVFSKSAGPAFRTMWDAMLEAKRVAAPNVSVDIVSTYRDATGDEVAWQRAVRKYLNETTHAREATGNPFGQRALVVLIGRTEGSKAPAGFSGHTYGIAADLATTENRATWTVNSDPDHQRGWQRTWLYGWLVNNAANHDFYQLKTETWHWEYHSDRPSRQCFPGDAPIAARPVPAKKKH